MASRYWVGGTDNWNGTAASKWSTTSGGAGGSAEPTSADDVFFDANSGANTVTVATTTAIAKSITCTGFTGTLTGATGIDVYGSVTAVAGMTWSHTGTVTAKLTAGTATITSAGKTMGPLTMNGAGGTLTFGDAFVTTGTCTLTAGTWNDGNQNLTMAAWSCPGTATRVQAFGSTNVWLVTGSGVVWNHPDGTGYTSNALSSPSGSLSWIDFAYSGTNARSIVRGSYLPNVRVSAGGGTFSTSSNGLWSRSLDHTGFAGTWVSQGTASPGGQNTLGSLTLSGVATYSNTGGGSWDIYPFDAGVGITLNCGGAIIPAAVSVNISNGTGTVLTTSFACTGSLTASNLDAAGFNVTCATFDSSNANTRTITMGSGTWTLTSTAATTVFNLATTTGLTLNPGTATIDLTGVTTSVRTITANSVLLPTIKISGGTGAGSVTLTNVNCAGLTFANTYACTGFANQSVTIRGPVTLSNHASFALTAGANAWTLASTSGSNAFESNGKVCDFPITVNGVGGTHAFSSAFSHGATRTLTLTNGTVDFGSYTHTMGFLASSNANVRTIDTGTSTLQFPTTGVLVDTSTSTNLTWTGTGTLKLTANNGTARSITAGTKRLPSLWVSAGTSTTTLTNVTGVDGLNMTGMGAGTIAAGSAAFAIGGSVTFVAAGTWSYTGALTFDATATGKTIDPAGKALTSSTVAFDGVGGGWTLTGTAAATGAWSLVNGALSVGNFTASTPSLTASGSATRSLTFGSGVVTLSGTGTVLDASGTGLTVTPGTGAFSLSNASGTARTVTGASGVTLPQLRVTAGSGSLTTTSCDVNGFDCTGFTGNWENNAITSRGSITLPAGMTASAAVSAATRITANGAGAINIGFTFDRTIYVGGGAWTLGAALALGSTRTFLLDAGTAGTFDDAGFALTAGTIGSSGASAATWTQRANYDVQGTSTCWSIAAATAFTYVSGRISLSNSSATGKTFAGGDKTYGELRYAPGSGTGALTLTGSNTFTTLSDAGTAAHAWKFTAGTTTHVTTWSIQGTAGNLITITSATAATHTIYADGGLTQADYLDISYSTAQPASLWQAMSNCVDSGNNQGWFGGASQQAMWATVRTVRNRQTARDDTNGGATRTRRARGGR